MSGLLTPEQVNRAVALMHEWLAAPPNSEGQSLVESGAKWDRERVQIIEKQLLPLVRDYLTGQTALSDFKRNVDGINKQQSLWGFKGIKGQMFFNMVVNVADDESECDQELKAALELPKNEDMASSRIKNFSSYVKRIGEHHIEVGGTNYEKPKVGSVPFFVSYFWQIQERDIWPVYYTSSVNTMGDINLWQPTGDLASDYLRYKHIHEELARIFTEESNQPFGFYEVEHVFWFKGGDPYGSSKPPANADVSTRKSDAVRKEAVPLVQNRLPESYVPPIIAILPRMAANETELQDAAKASGISLAGAFEKSINAAFTVLGYEAKLLGQGKGRVPDGQALALDDSYAILWDAKVRTDSYTMGTDDRTIKDYIVTQGRDLTRIIHDAA